MRSTTISDIKREDRHYFLYYRDQELNRRLGMIQTESKPSIYLRDIQSVEVMNHANTILGNDRDYSWIASSLKADYSRDYTGDIYEFSRKILNDGDSARFAYKGLFIKDSEKNIKDILSVKSTELKSTEDIIPTLYHFWQNRMYKRILNNSDFINYTRKYIPQYKNDAIMNIINKWRL